jgi:hypothetical protein
MADEQGSPADDVEEPPEEATTEVVVRPHDARVAVGRLRPQSRLQTRTVALRAALAPMARNPVVVGAGAAAATFAVRVAVEVARRALAGSGSGSGGPVSLEVSGTIAHEVNVERHVHVVQEVVHHVVHHHVVHHVPGLQPWRPPLGPPPGP